MVVLHKSIICSFLVQVLQLLSWPKTSKNRQDQSRSCGAVEPVQIAFWTSPRPQLWLLTALNSPGRQLAKDLKETHRARPSPQCSEFWNLLILRKGVRRLDPPTRDASLSLWMRANKFSHRFCISSKLSRLGTNKVPESSEAVLRIQSVPCFPCSTISPVLCAPVAQKNGRLIWCWWRKSQSLLLKAAHTKSGQLTHDWNGDCCWFGCCDKPFCWGLRPEGST